MLSNPLMASQFVHWLATYFKQEPSQVEILLRDMTAIRFLMTWSIFESTCFNGFMKKDDIKKFSSRASKSRKFRRADFNLYLEHFHNRYQDEKLYANLMHTQKSIEFEQILQKHVSELTDCEAAFFLLLVVYRYRNNIFHGNKGVNSWLQYQTQINHCSTLMQHFVGLVEVPHS